MVLGWTVTDTLLVNLKEIKEISLMCHISSVFPVLLFYVCIGLTQCCTTMSNV